jgi:16S rRNA (cytosine1402-N4)-methyltransferase
MTHTPVMLKETIHYLNPQPKKIYCDATIGTGFHAKAILECSAPSGVLIGIDQDPDAIKRANSLLQKFKKRLILQNNNFIYLKEILNKLNIPGLDGILLDLGLSLEQIQDPKRGFSFKIKAPLDMRMSKQGETAEQLLKRLTKEELQEILSKYGNEKQYAAKLANKIISEKNNIKTTLDLASIVRKIVKKTRKIDPATKTFQAIRIAVNNELENLKKILKILPLILNPGARAVIISFHSEEDRIVKQEFAQLCGRCICPPHLPKCICNPKKDFTLLTKRAVKPSSTEIKQNPQARSARLRAIEKNA